MLWHNYQKWAGNYFSAKISTGEITMTSTNSVFRQQMEDDIKLIQEKVDWDENIPKDPYAFNYWVLTKIYDLGEDVCGDNVTEYNDKGVDCFVHYEEDKELYIIQNKYYNENTPLDHREVSSFLNRPLAALESGKYTRSPELQKIYNKAKNDSEYKLFMHFYITNDKRTDEIDDLIRNYNKDHSKGEGLFQIAEIFYLSDINDIYYKEPKDNAHLSFKLSIKDDKSLLTISPNLADIDEAYYMVAKVQDIYQLWLDAKEKKYPLFEKNIREYLGGGGKINKSIMETLIKYRHKFFYYNNGITIICREASVDSSGMDLIDPQVANGCQTVSSIAEVFKNRGSNKFDDVYVMMRIFVIKKRGEGFSKEVVKYSNSQNSINEKAFGAAKDMFLILQKGITEQGFLLCVKQSDKQKFKEKYKDNKLRVKLLKLANKNSGKLHKFKTIPEVQVNLEHLILIVVAFSYKNGALIAYTKKSHLLKPSSAEYYQNISMRINDLFTTRQMVKLIILYKRAEHDKKASDDKKTPITYYLFNFLGFYLKKKGINLDDFLDKVSIDELIFLYEWFKNLPGKYRKKINFEYNVMLKKDVDENAMQEVLDEQFDIFKEYRTDVYKEFEEIFKKFE